MSISSLNKARRESFSYFSGYAVTNHFLFFTVTASLFLPLERRLERIRRPAAVDIRRRKPWSLSFFLFDG